MEKHPDERKKIIITKLIVIKNKESTQEPPVIVEPIISVVGEYNSFLYDRKNIGQGAILEDLMRDNRLLLECLRRFSQQEKEATATYRQNMISPLSHNVKMLSLTGPLAEKLRLLLETRKDKIDSSKFIPLEICKGICKTSQLRNVPVRPLFEQMDHQVLVRNWFRDHRSILLNHSLGSGKTCTATLCISDYLTDNPSNYVFFISPGGLRRNFIEEFCTYCPYDRRNLLTDEIEKNIRYLSLDDTRLVKKIPERFNNCLVVIDEVHHVNSAIGMEFSEEETGELVPMKTMKSLYNTLIRSRDNFKLILMSGTPMDKKFNDHYCILSLLKPEFPNLLDFRNLFKENDSGCLVPINKDSVKELYKDCISCYSVPEDLLPKIETEEIVIEGREEHKKYINHLFSVEVAILAMGMRKLVSEYMAEGMTRFAATAKAKIDIFRASTHDKSSRASMISYPNKDVTEDVVTANVKEYGPEWLYANSPKLNFLLNYVLSHPGKHSIYTPFKTEHGSNIISYFLTSYGISNVVYSGDLSSDNARSKTILNYNDKENLNGEKIKAIILTNAGNEGLTLLNVKYVHVLHQYIYETKIQQVIGRHIRLHSHDDLPPDERKVHIMRYFFGSPDSMCFRTGIRRLQELKIINNMVKEEFCIEQN